MASSTESRAQGKELTPEQIRLVAEKVYQMFVRDMKLARERTGRAHAASRVNRTTVDRRRW